MTAQAKEDAHHQEQVAKSEMRKALAAAPRPQKAPDIAQRTRIRTQQAQNAYGRNDTILTGNTVGGATEYGAQKTLLGQ